MNTLLISCLIVIGILFIVASVILVVSIAWIHHPEGIIRSYLRNRKGGNSNGKNR